MQSGKQPLWVRLQLLARLTLNAGEDAANQPARLAHLDDGNDRAILVQRHQGPAQIVRLGHRGTPSIDVSDEIATLAARPIASLRWNGDGFELPVRGTKSRGFPQHSGHCGSIGGLLYHLMVHSLFACVLSHSYRARLGHGLSRLWLAALRGGFRLLVVQLIYTFALHLLN